MTPIHKKNMGLISKLFFLGTLVLVYQTSINAASFNCKRASTSLEKTICLNKELSKSDGIMGSLYRKLSNALPKNQVPDFKERHNEWLDERTKNCPPEKASCLLKDYYRYNVLLTNELSLLETKPKIPEQMLNLVTESLDENYNNIHFSPSGCTLEVIEGFAQTMETITFPLGMLTVNFENGLLQFSCADGSECISWIDDRYNFDAVDERSLQVRENGETQAITSLNKIIKICP